jgi:hypothetical protein
MRRVQEKERNKFMFTFDDIPKLNKKSLFYGLFSGLSFIGFVLIALFIICKFSIWLGILILFLLLVHYFSFDRILRISIICTALRAYKDFEIIHSKFNIKNNEPDSN